MNEEHYEQIKKGPETWNAYVSAKREEHLSWRADLFSANLSEANLSEANLSEADLSRANLPGANLFRANLSEANLSEADLSRADLFSANLPGANLPGANLSRANLFSADLSEANLFRANLFSADLSGANLSSVKIGWDVPKITDKDKAAIARAVRGELYDQMSFGDVCGTKGCLAFHIVKNVEGGEVFAAWFRSIPFAGAMIWPDASHLFYQGNPEPVLRFTEEFLPKEGDKKQ